MSDVARRQSPVPPIPRDPALDRFEGQWVAVKDGRVVAHGPNARDVVVRMREMGSAADGAVLQRAASATEALAIGLG